MVRFVVCVPICVGGFSVDCEFNEFNGVRSGFGRGFYEKEFLGVLL